MTYPEKVAAWNDFIKARGISKGYSQFPNILYIRLGREPAPLMFWQAWQVTVLLGINYAVGWGILMHYFAWNKADMPIEAQLLTTAIAGLCFGGLMTLLIKRQKKKNELVSWEQFLMGVESQRKP